MTLATLVKEAIFIFKMAAKNYSYLSKIQSLKHIKAHFDGYTMFSGSKHHDIS